MRRYAIPRVGNSGIWVLDFFVTGPIRKWCAALLDPASDRLEVAIVNKNQSSTAIGLLERMIDVGILPDTVALDDALDVRELRRWLDHRGIACLRSPMHRGRLEAKRRTILALADGLVAQSIGFEDPNTSLTPIETPQGSSRLSILDTGRRLQP